MHEHVICNSKNIMGSAQSNPTSTHVCNKLNTHLRMHGTLLQCKWDVMHDVLRSKIQNPSQKFCKTFLIWENPKFFIKPQKLGHKRWNTWKRRIRILTRWRKTWSRLKNPWGRGLEWVREVLVGEESREIERDQAKWVWDRENPLYRTLVIFDK